MTIKHTSKFRQKVLSFLLGLSLLFNVLAPVTTVLVDTLPTYTIDYYAVRDGFMVSMVGSFHFILRHTHWTMLVLMTGQQLLQVLWATYLATGQVMKQAERRELGSELYP